MAIKDDNVKEEAAVAGQRVLGVEQSSHFYFSTFIVAEWSLAVFPTLAPNPQIPTPV